tara:strand:+ start:473 stop:907 length:435 start_codon:yes stop_codon:yes gene_type:complete
VTCFVLSHNLQIQSEGVPPLVFEALAKALKEHCSSIQQAEALDHSHWKIRLESTSDPADFAVELAAGWRSVRRAMGHEDSHAVLALGGRKDSPGNPGAPLQQGGWGVDVVETADASAFLQAINWAGLTAGRPADGVFEVINQAG